LVVGPSGAGATAHGRGCCFSIGFGELMEPCCLQATTDVEVSDCAVGDRVGGATGFSKDHCPSTAQQASDAMLPAVSDSNANAENDAEGCCFSIGFGNLMQPCCLQTMPNVTESVCSMGNRKGGATGFMKGGCPITADEAHQHMQPVALELGPVEIQGCCFSIGFGDQMQPCCLETWERVWLSVCPQGSRDGAATGFSEGTCPSTAEEAHHIMQPVVLKEEVQGCCFSIGFGDGMLPCCLETAPSVALSACHTGRRMGGTTGFTTGVCPSTAEEAHASMEHSTAFVGSMQSGFDVTSSSVSSVLFASVSFTVGALAAVVVVSCRRRVQNDDVAFVPLDA